MKKEAFRTKGVVYIEPLASRPLHVFQESSESSREGRDIE